MTDASFAPCIVIPIYNHERPLPGIMARLDMIGLPCILVDDGSQGSCATVIDSLCGQYSWARCLRLPVNLGKGGAVKAGLRLAASLEYSHVVQVDADGQHDLNDLEVFLDSARRLPDAVVTGIPLYDASIPKLRYYARFLTHFWVYINTLSQRIPDAMCGYRVYPVKACMDLLERVDLENRMAFDVEILVRLDWQGVRIVSIPTKVAYPEDGVSHFRGWEDNMRISLTHALLFLGMLRRLPRLLARHY
jgi:glycosyltransferase involved in cell wall biosynthesis